MNPVIIVFVIATGYVARKRCFTHNLLVHTNLCLGAMLALRPAELQNDSRVQIR